MKVPSTFMASTGDGYELQMGRWSRRLAPRLVEFAGIRGAVRVLDVGCGTGNLCFCLAESNELLGVQGVDISPAYIAHAKRRRADTRLGFEVGDGCALPFADASFDHAVSMLALQFIPRFDLALQEMRRVTRPGGTVAAATWDTRGGGTVVRMILDAAAMVDPGGNAARAAAYTRPLSRPGELADAWRKAGLADVIQDMVTIRMEFTCFVDFWTPVEGQEGPVAQYVTSLGRSMRAELRNRVQSAYLDGEGDGPRSYAATAWIVKGRMLG